MANRLATSLSPYLRQHAGNPVHWQEWGPEAFAEANHRDCPIVLSVGYAACHWCHVMAHESFESPLVAEALNDRFVAIKVDREERPDVDAIYMAATTALTGRGGWPMTVLMAPSGTPFWAGTYLPRAQFLALLDAAADAWASRRDEVASAGDTILAAMTAAVSPQPAVPIDRHTLAGAVEALGAVFDRRHGGFGRAPKFPPSMALAFLLRHSARTGSVEAMEMVTQTCEAMAYSGMYDQVWGGFARYAVDAAWVVPHFEKMLYDNALLARVYGQWWRATGHPTGERVARETCDALLRDFLTDEGGFASALDADTDGVEGLTYVWTPTQLVDVLGLDDGERAAAALTVTDVGTFEHGSSTLQWGLGVPDAETLAWWHGVRSRLRKARDLRPQPARDDKVVTSWNGLAIAALAEVGSLFLVSSYVNAAICAADLILSRHVVGGELRRLSRAGEVGNARGVADDYGNLAEGCLALYQATAEPRWLVAAGELLATATRLFGSEGGVFFDTPADTDLIARPHSAADNAEPSGQSSLAAALLTYAVASGSAETLAQADAAIAVAGEIGRRDPRFAGWSLAAAEARTTGPISVVIVGADLADKGAELLHAARQAAPPGSIVIGAAAGDGNRADGIPLALDRPLLEGQPTAYVCRGSVCSAPVTAPTALRSLLTLGSHPMTPMGET
jgi:uncharacterized protein YyaL (SSP411 family)